MAVLDEDITWASTSVRRCVDARRRRATCITLVRDGTRGGMLIRSDAPGVLSEDCG